MVTHAFWSGWYLFTVLAVPPCLRTQSVMLGFWSILVASIVVTWPSSFSEHRFKLEPSILCSIFFKETLSWKYFFCVQQKVFRAFIFSCLVLSWYILASLVKTFPKWVYFFSFSILKWHILAQANWNKFFFIGEYSYKLSSFGVFLFLGAAYYLQSLL